MRLLCSLTIFLITSLLVSGQSPVGTWSDHLNYDRSFGVAAGKDFIFSSNGSSILTYDRKNGQLGKLSKVNGLTETGISAIAWSEPYKCLIIGYKSTNVDLVINNTVYNIPDIFNEAIPGLKMINKIRSSGKFAYLACSFGIVVIDLERKEIHDTWRPGAIEADMNVFDIALSTTDVFAATDKGVYRASLTAPGLSYHGNWSLVSNLPDNDAKYNTIIHKEGKLYLNLTDAGLPGDYFYSIDGTVSLIFHEPGIRINSADISPDGFTLSATGSVRYYNQQGILQKSISYQQWDTPVIVQAVESEGEIWIADVSNGLIRIANLTSATRLVLEGPATNNIHSITASGGKAVITGGGITDTWNNRWKPLEISIFENNRWNHITSTVISDPLNVAFDPSDNDHFFVSTWGYGLLEYRNNALVRHYNEYNSPLQSILPGQPYSRISGLAFDKNKNLWITQTQVQGNLKVLNPSGSWFFNPELNINSNFAGDIIITHNDNKWIILPGTNNIFILDDNRTPENFSDDRSIKMIVRDNEGNIANFVLSVALDADGTVWVGTDKGPFIYYNPENAFMGNYNGHRVKTPRNDGTNLADYMLGTETITSISVDGANRKWIGTKTSGVYLLSADGTGLIGSFNELNSPLFSNHIIDINADIYTGDVWIGTSAGIQSYRGNAIQGKEEFSNVYAFPNPVRKEFEGTVTITGLMNETEVRITDISGNLVHATISNGGQATWDLMNSAGRRVATGVYIVFCSAPGTKQAAVTKILVFN